MTLFNKVGRFNLSGLYLIHDYYLQKNPQFRNCFIIHNIEDINTISKCIPSTTITAFIFYQHDGHITPILKFDNQFIIFDSMAMANIFYTTAIISALRKAGYSEDNIYYSTHQRQIKRGSCGSDAFVVVKAGLRLGNALFEFIRTTEKNSGHEQAWSFAEMPLTIIKYTQSYPLLFGGLGKKGYFSQFAASQNEVIPINKAHSGKTETVFEYMNRHPDSFAVERRSVKQFNYANTAPTTEEQFYRMACRASGIDLVKENLENLSARALNSSNNEIAYSELEQKFLQNKKNISLQQLVDCFHGNSCYPKKMQR